MGSIGEGVPDLPLAAVSDMAANLDARGDVMVNAATHAGYAPELAHCFPQGAGKTRIMHYFSEFMPHGEPHTPATMRRFVREYFVPQSTLRIQLLNEVTHLTKTIDIPFAGIPHFLDICERNKIVSMRAHFGDTFEHRCDPSAPPPPAPVSYSTRIPEPVVMGNTSHIVESQQMLQIATFVNSWQGQRVGMFRALLAPYTTVERVTAPAGAVSNADGTILQLETRLHIQFLCFTTLAQSLLVPTSSLYYGLGPLQVPASMVEEIISYGQRREKRRHAIEEGRTAKRQRVATSSEKDESDADTDPVLDSPAPTETPPKESPPPRFTVPLQNGPPFHLNEWGVPDGLIYAVDVCVCAHPDCRQRAPSAGADGHLPHRGARADGYVSFLTQ